MDTYTRAMLRFVQEWHPYGGCDDQIMPEFGITETTFYQRVLAILEHRRHLQLDDSERLALRSFCITKLHERGPTYRTGFSDTGAQAEVKSVRPGNADGLGPTTDNTRIR
ncbi:DUF3263 domain-containing protein [Rhodococcus jostii]|uniref:DUF3263 domain-containing protein n=1 Tax=Rhodococcus jostii TaxID=132919 RepID=A0A1H4QWQ1_RHOJO|nr:DUF3263 domain-containing protein [Rhodococcus jostii]SEC24066.1 Protein of unknown function [Rhodococcus jostii]